MADSVSTEECAACMAAEQQKKCCSDNLDAAQVKFIKAQAPLCCSTEFVDAKVKDDFISAKTDIQNISSLKFTVPVTVDFSSDPVNRSFSFKDKDSSPPTLQTNHLYLLNSIFLI